MSAPAVFPNYKVIDKSNFHRVISYALLKVNERCPFPPQIIKVCGTTIATVGNFSASTGKPKSKKTFNVSAIVASALCEKEVLNYRTTLPPGKSRVLYVDTEQSRPHCQIVLRRIITLAGLSNGDTDIPLDFLVLREFAPEQRRAIIECALDERKDYGLVIIDGVRDLLRDINHPGESIDVISDLMRWSSVNDLHIHTVLHLNKSDDNTRGHIGSELNNKAETILQITKNAEFPNMSEVRAVHIRDREFAPFSFEIGADALPRIVVNTTGTGESRLTFARIPEERHREALEKAFGGGTVNGYESLLAEIRDGYGSVGYNRGRSTMVKLVKILLSKGVIVKRDRDYAYNPDAPINMSNDDTLD